MIYRAICFSFRIGLFNTYLLETDIAKYRRKKIYVWQKKRATLSLDHQKDLFRFLNLYYIEGQNLYYMIQVYVKTLTGPKKRLFRKILMLMRHGVSFVDIITNSKMCNSELNMILSLSDKVGNYGQLFNSAYELSSNKISDRHQLTSKLSYPIMLLVMVSSLLVFISLVLIPQFRGFYVSYNIDLPLLIRALEWPYLLAYAAILSVIIVTIGIFGKTVNQNLLLHIPVVSKGIKLRFQNLLFKIISYAIMYRIPINLLIDKVLENEKSMIHKFYLSTISILIKQGKQLSEILDIPIIEKKYQNVLVFAQGQDKQQMIMSKMIIENKEDQEAYYQIIVNITGFLAMIFAGLLVFLIGYLMMSPLQNMSNIL
ncbi:MAG: hypothetical protein A2Y40_10485 [Candidatus Margulisbacteria bacterium GWF2_35_9]|nr:MAG: hypothetical protein A2Y40_10485 [Candidatus Margulisbacteria bacterium GWF2_35_9]